MLLSAQYREFIKERHEKICSSYGYTGIHINPLSLHILGGVFSKGLHFNIIVLGVSETKELIEYIKSSSKAGFSGVNLRNKPDLSII